jgi:hypothetical protein
VLPVRTAKSVKRERKEGSQIGEHNHFEDSHETKNGDSGKVRFRHGSDRYAHHKKISEYGPDGHR